MGRFIQSVRKEFSLLLRDKVGLALMFAMPIILVLVITSLQNNTFKIINDHQIGLIIFNHDTGSIGAEFSDALESTSMFYVVRDSVTINSDNLSKKMESNDVLVGIWLPSTFSENINNQVEQLALLAIGQPSYSDTNDTQANTVVDSLNVYYSPVLQESFRKAVDGTIQSTYQVIQSKKMLNSVFMALNDVELPAELEHALLQSNVPIKNQVVTSDGTGKIPNASQHNVPAWTIFAMFFMVVSLGSSLVREKRNGSFIRLKTMPGAYIFHILSKQFVYILAALAQVLVIFSLGVFAFPLLGLPALNVPTDITALFLVSLACGLSAVSYALCLGVYAQTEEQSNGFGAVSIVILAALGGILVPAFAMPDTFRVFTVFSPLYWCLEAYYELFLNNSGIVEILRSIIPLCVIILLFQSLALIGLKRKNLI